MEWDRAVQRQRNPVNEEVAAQARAGLQSAALRCQRRHMAAIILGFSAVMVVLLYGGGINRNGDATWYLAVGRRMATGQDLGSGPLVQGYPGYVGLVALAMATGSGPTGIVAFQILTAAAAVLSISALVGRTFGARAGLLAALLVACNPDISEWHRHILTESLYTSLVTLSVYAIYRAPRRGREGYAGAALAVVASISIRPTGLVLIPVAIIYWASVLRVPIRATVSGLGALLILLILFVSFSPYARKRVKQVRVDYGEVIRGYPALATSMPVDAATWGAPPLRRLEYVATHPLGWFYLLAKRVCVEAVHVRPYFSTRHNLFIVVLYGPLYALAALASWRFRRDPLVRLLVLVVCIHAVPVALFYASWEGRYLIYVTPEISALAAIAATAPRSSMKRSRLRCVEPSLN